MHPLSTATFDLPQELIGEIIHLFKGDRISLLGLSLVSSRFRVEAQKLLFRRVAFLPISEQPTPEYVCFVGGGDEEDTFQWTSRFKNAWCFLSVVNSNHATATHVYDFSISLEKGKPGTSDVHHALRQMVNLRRLQITLLSSINISMAVVLTDLPFQLDELCIMDMRDYPTPEENIAYHTFISSQHRLRYLHLVPGNNLQLPPPPPFHCPTLETFIGVPSCSTSVFQCLPPITTLGLEDSPWACPVPTSVLDAMSPTLSHVRSLALFSSFFSAASLEKLTEHLQSLETLHIALAEGTTTNRLTKIAMQMLHYVHKLPRLRTFIWSAHTKEGKSLVTLKTQQSLSSYWFEKMPSFEVAYFVAGHGKDVYRRWSRREQEPDEVSSLEFRHCTPFNNMIIDDCLSQ